MATKNVKSAITGKPVWLITGCSTGFGRELDKQLVSAILIEKKSRFLSSDFIL